MDSRVRVKTGIEGLDRLIEGGFVPNTCILVTGETGTGKTIFGCQYLNEGLKNEEMGLYLTLEQSTKEVTDDVARFGWDFNSNFLAIMEHINPAETNNIVDLIAKQIEENKVQRVVIDSLTLIGSYLDNLADIRKTFHNIKIMLKKHGCTSILISEVPQGSNSLSRYGVEEFIVDGVVEMRVGVDIIGGRPRSLIVRKMRRTKHDVDVHPIEIGPTGIKLIG